MLNDAGYSNSFSSNCSTSFSKVEFIYVSRNANCVAHALAKECGPQTSVSLEDRQSFIFTLLIDDVSVI
jgi:hypothetical protein